LQPERWGSPLVQEKCQEEKACAKRHPYNNNNNNNNRLQHMQGNRGKIGQKNTGMNMCQNQ